MTTSWAHLVRGELLSALACNVGGALLGMLAIASVPWLLISAAVGRWLGWAPKSTAMALVGAVLVLATLVQWVFRLVSG